MRSETEQALIAYLQFVVVAVDDDDETCIVGCRSFTK
jgi:hypothetical protein